MRSCILAFLAILAWTNCAPAQAPEPPPAAPPPIDSGFVAPDLTVPVMINGQGPFQFAIDSGSTTTLIAADLAEKLQLPEKGRVRVHAMSGTAYLRTVQIETIQISAISRQDLRVAAVSREHLGADGLLGINLLKNQRVTLDFADRTIRIEPSTARAEEPAEKADVDEIVVTAKLLHGQLVMADADADGQKVWVIVDSGSQASVGNFKLMDLLVKRHSGHEIRPVSLVDVLGRVTQAEYTLVERLRLGGMSLSPIPIAFADAHPFRQFGMLKRPALLLGMETLQNFRRVNIDFAARKVSFEMAKGKLQPTRRRP